MANNSKSSDFLMQSKLKKEKVNITTRKAAIISFAFLIFAFFLRCIPFQKIL